MPSTPATSTSDEAALLESLRRGDAQAYERLVRDFSGRLLATARRVVSNEEDAMDVVQEAFLSAFRSIDRFAGDSTVSTWLHRITINAAISKLRKRKRRQEVGIDDLMPRFLGDGHHESAILPWKEEVAGGAAESVETRALVRRMIDQLPEGFRTVVVLRDIEGLDTAETAKFLEVTENTVKVRLHRARLALRALLDPYWREGVV
jgi:RNA polymerase sigma-70 factor (ECF subfamily)